MEFAAAFRNIVAREKSRMDFSDRGLAEAAHLNHSAVRKFLRGGDVRMATAFKLAGALRVDLWRLVREAGEEVEGS